MRGSERTARAAPLALALAIAFAALAGAPPAARAQGEAAGPPAGGTPAAAVPRMSDLAPEVVDLPNDDGEKIAVLWSAAPGERDASPDAPPLAYEYVVSIAAPETRRWVEVERVPARLGWKSDVAEFGLFAAYAKEHAVVIPPAKVFSPGRLADATLGDAKAEEEVRATLGAPVIAAAREVLAGLKVHTPDDLEGYPAAIDDVRRRIVLGRPYLVRVDCAPLPGAAGEATAFESAAPVAPAANWFDWTKANNLVVTLLVGGAVLFFISAARRNPNLYLRRIGGLAAIDEALGRATEMGKPVLFVHGLETLQKVPTIAAINILGEVAKKVAEYDTKLLCANYDPIVLTVSQETVREGYLRAGRPDAYNQDDIFVAGAEQFSYVAAVDGIMLRQRPAANIYAGYFYAESLLLAETGAETGAIQIAATDAYTQLPFFVTTCDYTLMGEELYAASAYLSRDPPLLGSLRGQDVGKAGVIAYVVLGTLAASLSAAAFKLAQLLVKT
jgi:hypothetical protein